MKKALLTIATLLTSLLCAITAFAAGGVKVAPGQVLVRVPVGTTEANVRAMAERHGCDYLRALSFPGWHVVARKDRNNAVREELLGNALQQTVNEFASEPGVVAQPDTMMYPTRQAPTPTPPNDGRYTDQRWHYEMINMPLAWSIQDGPGTRIKVGVADSGIDATHPDFQTPAGVSRVILARDFTGNGTQIDIIGHGTHVAGTIAASTNNTTGVAGIAGWEKNGVQIDLIDARVFHDGGSPSSIIIDGIKYLGDQGCKVINLSLGGLGTVPDPAEVDVINYVRGLGAIVVAGAGNDGLDVDGGLKFFPADIPGALKVTAVGPSRLRSSYSNYGGNIFIAAPGGDGAEGGPDAIWSTVPIAGSQLAPATANGYWSINGTSMATPHVAGAVALMVAAGGNEAEIIAAIQSTAQIPPGGPNPKQFGPGILDVYGALQLIANPTPRILPASSVVDRGVTYFSPLALRARLFGVVNMIVGSGNVTGKQVHQSDVNIDIYRLGDTTPFKTFQGGRDFLIPALKPGERKTTSFTVDVPSKADDPSLRPTDPGVDLPDFNLPLGNDYKIVYRVGSTVYGTQFIKLDIKRLPRGRSMFAIPFKADQATGLPASATKEQLLLGTASSFGLARYNPLRLPSEEDYARYRSNGSTADPAARFIMGSTATGPLTYDIASPSVSIAPIGLGYWLDLADETAIDTLRLTAGKNDALGLEATNAVGIRVFSSGGGWNMIGSPFTFPVEWSSVTVQVDGVNYSLAEAVNNGAISPALVGYDAERRDYVYAIAPDGVLKPFNAYWVRAYKNATIIVPPSQALTRAVGRPIKNEGWTARLVASVAGDQDSQNYFGQVRGAVDGEDRLDIPKPPAGSGHAYVRFEQKVEQATRGLAFDLREPNSNGRQTWRAAVSSDRSNADVTLSWDGLKYVPRRYKVTLIDEATGQTVPMQGRASYRYRAGEAGATRYFQIVLEPQASGGPLLFSNVRTETTRAISGTTVRFLLSQDAEVVGTVRALSGKVVATMSGDTRAVARKESTLRWTGRAQNGTALPAGAYVLDITATGTDGSSVKLTRTIQVLR